MAIRSYAGTNQDIEKIATGLRAAIERDLDNSVQGRELLREIVSRTGGKIEVVEDPSRQETAGGSLVIREPRDYTIYLSPFTTTLRDNFTIAHELGHFFLHYHLQPQKPELPLCFTRYGTEPAEWQANRFAAALLMPEIQFKEQYNLFQGEILRLSGWFDVSSPAVEVRAQSLGLLAEVA